MLAAIIVVEASSILIISTEAGKVTANIHTASDALWWSLVTVATVGYGDLYPVTNPGRLVGVLMMIVGVGVFSVLTSFLAKWFLAPQRKKILPDSRSIANLPIDMRSQLAGIRKLIDEQETSHQEAMAELREQLDEIERQLLRSG
jgi:voltage-gated potassium channel